MPRRRPDRDPLPPATATRRRALRDALAQRSTAFEELRALFELSPRALDDELRHLVRSARRAGGRLEVIPAKCLQCGARLPPRGTRLRPPQRCPRCRAERVTGPWIRLDLPDHAPP